MARIKDASVAEVRAAIDMVELVSQYTPLRRSGARYTGRCPFHEERTPSFSVNAVDKLYHCFGCGKGGDAISLVRELEQLDFAEAIAWLGDRFNVELEYEEVSPQVEEKRRRLENLYSVLEQATAYYERHLWDGPAGEPVRAYLETRGLGEAICREFRLGLSPGHGLAAKARQKGFSVGDLRGAGLVNARGNDYFPRRLMFPLADARGRVVGFQARKLHDDDPLRGKYVNSPEGELFHKSAILYGLHLARAAIAKQDRAIIVEGNTDVIALRQGGLEPVVAAMGTALTEQHVRELSRLTRRVYLCFDADAAGEAATLRGMELAVKQGFDVRVVALAPGNDPADAAEGFEERLDASLPYPLYRVKLIVDDPPDRQTAYREAKAFLDGVTDSPERHEAWRYVNDRLGMTVQLQSAVATVKAAPVSPRVLAAGERLERDALAGCLAHLDLIPLLAELTPDHFDGDANRRLHEALVAGVEAPDDLVALRAELSARGAAEEIDQATGRQLLLRLRERQLRRELAAADLERTPELQAALSQIREAVQALS
ncbi:MAG TPA: DNA primase [Gaiellaceae bacterium]|nr:DNA primase [Gaiellaceae bacterium]